MSGYIFSVTDPLSNKVCYIGEANQPWENLKRHKLGGGNPDFTKYLNDLPKYFPNKRVVWFGEIGARSFYDPEIVLPQPNDSEVLLEWNILCEAGLGFSKQEIIREYQKNNEAWFNKPVGRKTGYSFAYMDALREEKNIRAEIKFNKMKKSIRKMTLAELEELEERIKQRKLELSASE